ncbi:hypothetical protein HETIRDRAFT_422272 [Heterobasidion irregulare TC 32-1]|uniref:Uncharacterized protein n=1 Tax=Heterobasidion irregulare (strain TC 32-1) TaxID=747525 RepID=W4JVN2_HETIT|nr:uncharacterized protein HETIRDRAFT_422272 [Heterobasidion irregulare TC 32-1]ETW76921.1 hypothetical protein HETIRDRAFT_422272 [Heterobasidion irregulare TC 32-1]
MPVFKGLLPACHDAIIANLLSNLATWNVYTKLHLHTGTSLGFFATATLMLGATIRCKAAMIKKGLKLGKNISATTFTSEKLCKIFNLVTYKYHALGDYIGMILCFRTTDLYSMQVGKLAHKVVKYYHNHTKKNNFWSDEHHRCKLAHAHRQKHKWPERLPLSNSTTHYHIPILTRKHLNAWSWIHNHPRDPALKEFLLCLKDHLLACVLGLAYDGDKHELSDKDCDNITIYVHVIGIFHCMVHHHGHSSEPKQMDFLWVCWFSLDTNAPGGWDCKQLHSVAFIPEDDLAMFGFLDPKQIIRSVHVIPAFACGHISEQLRPSIAQQPAKNDEDWERYYINMFVEHGMFMRFHGSGISHKDTWHLNASLLQDGQAAQVPEEPSNAAVDEQGGAEDDNLEEESKEEEGEEGPLVEEEEEEKEKEEEDNNPDPLPEDNGREQDERVLAEEGYGEF